MKKFRFPSMICHNHKKEKSAKSINKQQQSILGKVEALARKNARSDRVFLDFLVTFLSRKK
jgi:hypothetical protein